MIPIQITSETTAECFGLTVRHRTPILEMARRLVADGFYRGCRVQAFTPTGTPSLTGRLGTLADLSVDESNTPRFVRYSVSPWAVARHTGVSDAGATIGSEDALAASLATTRARAGRNNPCIITPS